jgi:hypothetical protein
MPLSTIVQPYHGDQFQLVWETGVLGEHHRPAECHWQNLSHNFARSHGITLKAKQVNYECL